MIDCSHGNSGKDPARQPLVFSDVIHQIVEGNRSIVGAMIESNLEWGNQPLAERSGCATASPSPTRHGGRPRALRGA
jgi:3-deoxy-7-phosphoheptulonate synthase